MEGVIAAIKSYAMKSAAGLSGFWAVLVEGLISYVIKQFKKLWKKHEDKKQAQEKLKDYQEKLEKPDASIEERRSADRDFLS